MISLQSVGMRYANGTEALRGIDFQVDQGEFIFLSGPSGAGKSTLIRLLLRIEVATEGEVYVFGRNLRSLRSASIPFLRRNIGCIFQDFRLLDDRSVFDNVALPLHILGLSRREIRRRVMDVLGDLSIDRYIDVYPPMLSGGEQQRVAIARALAMHPALILADEPTGNLDWDLSREIVRLLGLLNERGATVLMATHDRFLIEAAPRRTLILRHGELVEDRPAGRTAGPKERP